MELMQRRREILAQGNGLPSAYRRVEWIKSTGTQYIATGIKGVYTFYLTAKPSPTGGGNGIILGSYITGGNYIAGNNTVWTLGGGYDFAQQVSEWANVTVEFLANGNLSATIGEETVARTGGDRDTYYYQLFGTSSGYGSTCAISKCICCQNGTKILDLIPCVRKSDNKPGMYDTVSKTFYTNAGTGEFIVPA